jgi:hypothetical protein
VGVVVGDAEAGGPMGPGRAPRFKRVQRRPHELAQSPTPLDWRVRYRPAYTLVEFYGDLDENADFGALMPHLVGVVMFNMFDLGHINSCGVREWIYFMRDFPPVDDLVYTHCSPLVVSQFNLVYNFVGRGRVTTFYAPYACEACGAEWDVLLDVESDFGGGLEPPAFHCQRCGTPLVFVEHPDQYFVFLRDVRASPPARRVRR